MFFVFGANVERKLIVMNCSKIVHGGDLAKAAVRFGLSPQEIIDFSANINFSGTFPGVKEAIISSLNDIDSYPEIDSAGLVKTLSNFYNVDSREILCGNGASELIYVLIQALRPSRILIPCPTFAEYEGGARGAQVETDFVFLEEKKNFYPDLDLIISHLPQRGMLFLCNPNNPTGILLKKKDLRQIILAANSKDTIVVIDESFMDFVITESEWSFLQNQDMPENLLVLRSLTKFFALPGLRLGFLRAHPQVREKIAASLSPWNVNILAQKGGQVLFADIAYLEKSRHKIQKEKEYLFAEIKKIAGLKPFPAAANFILVKVEKGPCNPELQNMLGRKGVYVRDCSTFRGLTSRFFRIAVKSRRENEVLLALLRTIFAEDCLNWRVNIR